MSPHELETLFCKSSKWAVLRMWNVEQPWCGWYVGLTQCSVVLLCLHFVALLLL